MRWIGKQLLRSCLPREIFIKNAEDALWCTCVSADGDLPHTGAGGQGQHAWGCDLHLAGRELKSCKWRGDGDFQDTWGNEMGQRSVIRQHQVMGRFGHDLSAPNTTLS